MKKILFTHIPILLAGLLPLVAEAHGVGQTLKQTVGDYTITTEQKKHRESLYKQNVFRHP